MILLLKDDYNISRLNTRLKSWEYINFVTSRLFITYVMSPDEYYMFEKVAEPTFYTIYK